MIYVERGRSGLSPNCRLDRPYEAIPFKSPTVLIKCCREGFKAIYNGLREYTPVCSCDIANIGTNIQDRFCRTPGKKRLLVVEWIFLMGHDHTDSLVASLGR